MSEKIGLRAKVVLLVLSLLLVTVGTGAVTMWLIFRIGSVLAYVIDNNVQGLRASQEMETSLTVENGFLTFYLLDGNPEWLNRIHTSRREFDEWLTEAKDASYTERQRKLVDEIASKHSGYAHLQEKVVERYLSGDREEGYALHLAAEKDFHALRDLCNSYKAIHTRGIEEARSGIRSQGRFINSMILFCLPAALIIGVVLIYILVNNILEPIRLLAAGAHAKNSEIRVVNEVKELTKRVSSLMEDVDHTQTQLQLSQEHLLQSEKLAMVGKLAASVAHTIRNPLTSVKMRLFSMERSLGLSETQKEDFEVISEEIRHIDNILRNFLEYSRPPKLKIQSISLSDVVDMAIQLLKHRIESYGVELELYRQRKLPDIEGDAEQLKEVFVNLILNACEAMVDGGTIIIREEEGIAEPFGHVLVVRVRDNGPGIPESVLDRVFEPFFSMKEEGTGLGLSIARRIIEDHHGCLNVRSKEGKGTTFTITLPCKEDRAWLRS
ncbi:MAG: ATP-binding protein [Syntrophobacteraceae bacterium]|nr:MCP four helix bundle domain-containing protein [Desulfobacteraceae bacterium]